MRKDQVSKQTFPLKTCRYKGDSSQVIRSCSKRLCFGAFEPKPKRRRFKGLFKSNIFGKKNHFIWSFKKKIISSAVAASHRQQRLSPPMAENPQQTSFFILSTSKTQIQGLKYQKKTTKAKKNHKAFWLPRKKGKKIKLHPIRRDPNKLEGARGSLMSKG